MLGKSHHGLVPGRESNPIPQAVALSHFEHGVDSFFGIAQIRNAQHASGIFRVNGNGVLIIQNVNGNSALSQTACNRQSRMIATYDHPPNPFNTSGRAGHRNVTGRFLGHSLLHYFATRWRATWEASSCDANSVPATKYSSGPKERAAGAPTKCKPGTEHENPAPNFG